MALFRGTFDHTLDAKNRLTVPSRYRAALADGVVLALPIDNSPCVTVWRPQDYDEYAANALEQLPALSPRLTQLERFLLGNSQDLEPDAANRVMVPAWMCREAGIDREVVVVGVGKRLELWDRQTWASQQQSLRDTVAEITGAADAA